jgi:hypothetical protein
MRQFLRLSYEEVELVSVALNNARIFIFTEKQRKRLPDFLLMLRRYYVATYEERKEDFEQRGRKPGATGPRLPGPTTLPFEDNHTVEAPLRVRSG